MTLYCAVCIADARNDGSSLAASMGEQVSVQLYREHRAITVVNGIAVCARHMDDVMPKPGTTSPVLVTRQP